MSERRPQSDRPNIGAVLSGITAFVVASATLGFGVGVPILVIFALYLFHEKLTNAVTDARLGRELLERWRGPDLKNYCYLRPTVILWGVVYRKAKTLPFRRSFWVALLALIIGGGSSLGLLALSSYAIVSLPEDTSKKMYVFLTLFSIAFGVTTLSYLFFREISQRLKRLGPHQKTVNEFVAAIKRYTSEYGSVQDIRKDIAIRDPGPIIVISIAARDLLNYERDTGSLISDVYQEALNFSPEKSFLVVLADPTSESIRARNKLLNGRYLEYYAIPYLRVMFKCREQKQAGAQVGRIRLFRWDQEPDYRVIASRDRMILQRYGPATHGADDLPVVLHRVNFSSELEKKIRDRCATRATNDGAGCAMLETSVASTLGTAISSATVYQYPPCVLADPGVWNQQEKVLQKEPLSIFSYFLDSFHKTITDCEEETFLTEWNYERLEQFATYCGVPRKDLLGMRNPKVLASAICHAVGLGKEFNRLNV